MKETDSIFWSPRGGNNAKDCWGSCHVFTSKETDEKTRKLEEDTIIVDFGRHEKERDFCHGVYDRVVPVLTDCLEVPGFKKPVRPAKAIFLTHGHTDHIGGIIPYIEMGAKLPPIYCSETTKNLMIKEFIENGVSEDKWPEMNQIKAGDTVEIGKMKVRTMQASHSVPGAFSFAISNDATKIFHSGDTKGDPSSFLEGGVNFDDYKKIKEEGPIDFMTFDSTNATNPGHATYESEVNETYKKLIAQEEGKQIVLPMAAAHAERLASILDAAQANGRDVILNGGATQDGTILGLQMSGMDIRKIFPNIKIVGGNDPEADKMDPKKTITITTGLYADKDSPFVHFLKGEDDKFKIEPDATIIVPLTTDKNERLGKLLKECPAIQGCKMITASDYPTMYGAGHAQSEDLLKIAGLLEPKMSASIHTSDMLAKRYIQFTQKHGIPSLPRPIRNGEAVQVTTKGCVIHENKHQCWLGLRHTEEGLKVEKFKDETFEKVDHYNKIVAKKEAYRTTKKAPNAFTKSLMDIQARRKKGGR